MNFKALKDAEKKFLSRYPGGFNHPEMIEIGKKHKIDQLADFAKNSFAKTSFDDPKLIIEDTAKLVSRSTMVSMFEKPKFRDFSRSLNIKEKEKIAEAIFELLHGKEKLGFEIILEELKKKKLAKWPLITVVQSYFRPQREVFVKPTTTKLIVEKLELDVVYNPTPSWDFYRKYRKIIKELKEQSNKSLSPNNPALCGFLMMALGDDL
ncbi:MAG: hypothetical protein ACI8RA_000399 [Chlamydiales bacterium]|jgi:hypothetical protein